MYTRASLHLSHTFGNCNHPAAHSENGTGCHHYKNKIYHKTDGRKTIKMHRWSQGQATVMHWVSCRELLNGFFQIAPSNHIDKHVIIHDLHNQSSVKSTDYCSSTLYYNAYECVPVGDNEQGCQGSLWRAANIDKTWTPEPQQANYKPGLTMPYSQLLVRFGSGWSHLCLFFFPLDSVVGDHQCSESGLLCF